MTLIGYPSVPKFTQGYSRLPKVAQGSPRIPNVTLGYLRMQFHKLAYSPVKLHLVSLRLPQERSKTDLIPALAPEVTAHCYSSVKLSLGAIRAAPRKY